jgi:hypothetical protein
VYRADDLNSNNINRLELLLAAARFISEHNADRNATFGLGLTPYSANTNLEMEQRAGIFSMSMSRAPLTNWKPCRCRQLRQPTCRHRWIGCRKEP